jgi:hypothetical protein
VAHETVDAGLGHGHAQSIEDVAEALACERAVAIAHWGLLQQEVLDREVFRSLGDAEAALDRYVRYYNYHRLHGEIGWLTPAERYNGTPFTDRGFENIPALLHLRTWLEDVRAAA